MIKIKRSGKFLFQLEKYCSDDLDATTRTNKLILLFSKNPDDTRLRDHALKRKLEGKWAFSVTSDIRIVYEWLGKNTVRFLAIGPHKAVYSRK